MSKPIVVIVCIIVGALTAPTSMAPMCRWRSRPHGVIAGASCPKPITSLGGWLFPDRMEIRAHDWTPGPSIEWRTAMEEYIGLDVSMKETSVSIRRAGERIWRGKCASDPRTIAELIRKRAPAVKRVVFETGPLSIWFYHSLRTEGLPAICIDARHAKAASIWRRTRRTRTTPMVWRSSRKSGSFVRCA